MAAADQGCPEVIEKVVANSRLTSSRFYYLGELEPSSGGLPESALLPAGRRRTT